MALGYVGQSCHPESSISALDCHSYFTVAGLVFHPIFFSSFSLAYIISWPLGLYSPCLDTTTAEDISVRLFPLFLCWIHPDAAHDIPWTIPKSLGPHHFLDGFSATGSTEASGWRLLVSKPLREHPRCGRRVAAQNLGLGRFWSHMNPYPCMIHESPPILSANFRLSTLQAPKHGCSC
jgi:hypothetical protein